MMSLRKPIFLAIILLQGYQFAKFKVSRPGYVSLPSTAITPSPHANSNNHNNNNSTNNSSRSGGEKLNQTENSKWIEGSTTSSSSTSITPSPYRKKKNCNNICKSTNNNSTNNNSTNNNSTNNISSRGHKINETKLFQWIEGSTTYLSSTTIAPSPYANYNSNKNHTAQPQPLATILVQLRGELCNHLSVWSHAKGLQLHLLQDYGIPAELVLRHQVLGHQIHGTRLNPKALPTASKFQQCFPNLRNQPIFGSANTEYFVKRYSQQADWLANKTGTLLSQVHQRWLFDLSRVNGKPVNAYETMSDDDIHTGLTAFDQLLRLSPTQKPITSTSTTTTTTIRPTSSTLQDTISIPFLYVTALNNNYMWNRYFDELRAYFAFDDAACCNAIPEPDEIVFVSRQSVCCMCINIHICIYIPPCVSPTKQKYCCVSQYHCLDAFLCFCFAFCIRCLVDPSRLLCFIPVHLYNTVNPNKTRFGQPTHKHTFWFCLYLCIALS
jgi:hypothetical protein